ncbi:TIGR04222 domain-containing membrane protein [Streptomyces sp. NBC_00316]|uniref:TIGR04222 domain-containing membrane protein n=1 Tax=Streptomyces sp. NBC_00316 TaxID=2975710 RepID=UPI003FA7DD52
MQRTAELDFYQTAYICGGRERVAMAVLIALLWDGQIKISPTLHRVNVVRGAPRDGLESAVLDLIPSRGRFLRGVVQVVSDSAPVQDIGRAAYEARIAPAPGWGALWQWGRLLTRLRLRRRLHRRSHLLSDALGRIAIRGTSGISDSTLRRTFEHPDPPRPVKLPPPRGPKMSNPYDANLYRYDG